MGDKDVQRTIGALQIVGGALELFYGGGYGLGGGGGYLIGSGLENVSGDIHGSAARGHRTKGFLADLQGSFTGHGPSKWGNYGAIGGGLLGGRTGFTGGGSGTFGGSVSPFGAGGAPGGSYGRLGLGVGGASGLFGGGSGRIVGIENLLPIGSHGGLTGGGGGPLGMLFGGGGGGQQQQQSAPMGVPQTALGAAQPLSFAPPPMTPIGGVPNQEAAAMTPATTGTLSPLDQQNLAMILRSL